MDDNVLYPRSAIAAWDDVTEAAQLLLAHIRSLDTTDPRLVVILANQVLTILVTGYEAYCERHFIELIVAGVPVDYAQLDRKLVPQYKQGALATLTPPSVLDEHFARTIIRRYRINFQDYENGKRAYTAAFGIRFGELPLPPESLTEIQRFLRYRHRIIHVSPQLALLDDGPPPVVASAAVASQAFAAFTRFIHALAAQQPSATNTVAEP